jgi:hypothetical protein
MRRFLLLPGALAIALLAAACGSDPAGPGPLGTAGNSGQQCVPATAGLRRTMGIFVLPDGGKSSVTVTSVTLTGDRGLKMGEPWLVPLTDDGHDAIGTAVWPPGGPAWAARKPADGAVIRPGQQLNLVFSLWHPAGKSGTASVTVDYKSAGTSYALTEGFTVQVADNC